MKQIGYGRMHGIPLIATSPIRNEEPSVNGFDISTLKPSWQMITDLAMHADLKNNEMIHSPAAYQDIVNQVS